MSAVAARYPGLRIAEVGDASEDRIGDALISQDFRKAEVTSVPITLILLIVVFGALIAAGHPAAARRDRRDHRDLPARHPWSVAAGGQFARQR